MIEKKKVLLYFIETKDGEIYEVGRGSYLGRNSWLLVSSQYKNLAQNKRSITLLWNNKTINFLTEKSDNSKRKLRIFTRKEIRRFWNEVHEEE